MFQPSFVGLLIRRKPLSQEVQQLDRDSKGIPLGYPNVYKALGPRVKSYPYLGKGLGYKDIYPEVHKFSKTFKSHLKLLGGRRIT
jgi:hypothetical protein